MTLINPLYFQVTRQSKKVRANTIKKKHANKITIIISTFKSSQKNL